MVKQRNSVIEQCDQCGTVLWNRGTVWWNSVVVHWNSMVE